MNRMAAFVLLLIGVVLLIISAIMYVSIEIIEKVYSKKKKELPYFIILAWPVIVAFVTVGMISLIYAVYIANAHLID